MIMSIHSEDAKADGARFDWVPMSRFRASAPRARPQASPPRLSPKPTCPQRAWGALWYTGSRTVTALLRKL